MADEPWPDVPWPAVDALVDEVRAWGSTWPGDRHALTDILGTSALAAAGTVAVVTGQQPAVGGGPLYTLVKAAHACALAARLRASGVAAVPVFWCASEDHDLGEADHADLLRADGRLRRVRVDLGAGRASLRFRPAALGWEDLLAACRSDLRGHLGASWLLSQRPVDGEGMGVWLCRLMGALFTGHGLVCVEGHRLRPLWRDALSRLPSAWPAAAWESGRQRLLAAGHGDAFGPLLEPPLFLDVPAGRTAVAPGALPGLLATQADALSPGAALRPILQQLALPAALVVVGPGERAYHRFLPPLYGALVAPRPRLVPRCSLTLVPSWCGRAVEHWGSSIAALMDGRPAPERPAPADALVGLDAALAELRSAAEPVMGDGGQRLRAGHARLLRERERLAASLERGRRRQAELPPWGALSAWVRPRGQLQERTMSLFQAIWEHGPGLADRLVAEAAALPPGGAAAVRFTP